MSKKICIICDLTIEENEETCVVKEKVLKVSTTIVSSVV